MRFEVNRTDTDGAGARWGWQLIDEPGAVVAYGEGYRSREQCEQAIRSVLALEADTPVHFEPRDAH